MDVSARARPVRGRVTLSLAATTLFVGCSDLPVAVRGDDPAEPPEPRQQCSIPQELIFSGGPGKDGIPALTEPTFVPHGGASSDYLKPGDRVVGWVADGQARAIPLNILWWHEIVNLDVEGEAWAITHCPLTGSTLAFDRGAVGGAEFGVSGLLYLNNLIMYDRTTRESMWPQMSRGARCGARDGAQLETRAVLEMTWEGWRTLYPTTLVVGSETGFPRDYSRYPYGDYAETGNRSVLFPVPGGLDPRRPPKERVLGFPAEEAAPPLALPFGLLDREGERAVVTLDRPSGAVVVLWDGPREAAAAYRPVVDGEALTLTVRDGRIVDAETGSEWAIDGYAVSGPRATSRLEPAHAPYVAFWFAWAAFNPGTTVWSPR